VALGKKQIGQYGRRLLPEPDMKPAQIYSQRPPSAQSFGGLTVPQRRYLFGWREAASATGIDSVEDLSRRPWPECDADTIIGVFRSGHLLASWLIVGHAGTWAVAFCGDGTVSHSVDTLADALHLVCPVAPVLIPT
jgi:hypothetical protein